jgi:hypothetical protein
MPHLLSSVHGRIIAAWVVAAASSAAAAIQPIAWYRLGDDDPGAVAGAVGNNPTLDHTLNHLDLTRAGAPHYSADVPVNAAVSPAPDKLSMKFFNFTGPLEIPQPEPNYYMRNGPAVSNTGAYALEAWVKSSPLGQGDDYTLITYNGTPFYNGIGFFQHGKNYVVRIGDSYEKVLAPASSKTWTHLAFVRRNSANEFYVDGIDRSDTSATAQSAPSFNGGSFYVGGFGNPLSMSPLPPRYLFNGLVDEARFFAYPTATANASTSDLLIANIPRELTWAGGSWRDPSNNNVTWCNTAPDDAIFGAASSGNVNLAAPITAGQLSFDASGSNYTLGGAAITLNAPFGDGIAANQNATINSAVVLTNDQRWDVAAGRVLSVNGAVSGGGLEKTGDGTASLSSFNLDSLHVSGGSVIVPMDAGSCSAGAVAVDAGAQLDLKNNRLLVRNGDIAALGALVKSRAIMTSMADAQPAVGLTTLGIGAAGQDAQIVYTYAGDANLDGSVDADDYFAIDSGYSRGDSAYASGDFNYSGKIDGDDFFIIDANVNRQGQGAFGGAFASGGVAAVPEPASIALAAALLWLCRRR